MMLCTQHAASWSIYLWMPGLDPLAVGARIRALRHKRGWSQQTLADRLPRPVNANYVSRWERGENAPSWSNLYALATAFGVRITALIPDDDDDEEARAA
jgi:transcriptional regulator with XRE-family HTH domain